MARITIDITPAIRADPSGIAYYILELIDQFEKLRPAHEFTLGIRPDKFKERSIVTNRGWSRVRYKRLIPPFYQLFAGPIDLFHSTGSLRVLGPQGSVLRTPRGLKKKIITLHDLIPMEGWYVPNTERWIAKRTRLIRETVKRVDAIITDSDFIKQRILSSFAFDADRIHTVWLGLNHDRFRVHDPGVVAKCLDKLKIDRPYFISFSAMYPRKNTEGLVRAFARTRAARDGLLLLGGNTRGEVYDRVAAECKRLRIENSVRFLGYVAHEDVPLLYCGARASLFPSLYEGFGLPVAEAFACGTPLATSDRSSMPEVGGDAAEYFDPENEDSIASALDNIYENESRRKNLIERGLERAKLFTWERTARATLEVYDRVLQASSTA
ncbi:MAG: glycosyltransferase family 4 protein [Planctomycetes bacterium]|nr:glycosyltransferase family 4 protein [Planctomycetota bacterium]